MESSSLQQHCGSVVGPSEALCLADLCGCRSAGAAGAGVPARAGRGAPRHQGRQHPDHQGRARTRSALPPQSQRLPASRALPLPFLQLPCPVLSLPSGGGDVECEVAPG